MFVGEAQLTQEQAARVIAGEDVFLKLAHIHKCSEICWPIFRPSLVSSFEDSLALV